VLPVSCTSPHPRPVAVVGRYTSHLSGADIQEIRRVVSAYDKMPLRKIDAVARKKSGLKQALIGSFRDIRLLRHDGNWLVDETAEFEGRERLSRIELERPNRAMELTASRRTPQVFR
jgi:hypothetical protein